jgi:hypothetical protein
VFFNLVESAGHVVHSGASMARNADTLFFIIGWAWCGFHKKRVGRRYSKLVFLHPVGSIGHVAHFGASGYKIPTHHFSCSGGPNVVSIKIMLGNIMQNLCFCFRWDLRVMWLITLSSMLAVR